MVPLHIEIHRDQQAQHLFLVHLHPATDRVGIRRTIQARGGDQIFSAQQQTAALRSTDALAAGERHEIETHACVLPQVLHGRDVGGGIVERGNAVLLSELCEFFVLDLTDTVVGIEEEHHRGVGIDRPFQILARFDFHHPHAAVANGMVVAEAVRLLDDGFTLHARQVGKTDDLLPVGAGQHCRRSQSQGRRRTGSDHRRFAPNHRGNPLADAIVQLVEHHVVFGGVGDRLHHFRRHQRGGHGGVGAGRVDERPYPEIREQVFRRRGGRHRRGSESASNQR